MTRRDDSNILYPEVFSSNGSTERNVTNTASALSPLRTSNKELLTQLSAPSVSRTVQALLDLPPSKLAQLFRVVHRYEIKADAKAAAEAEEYLRQFARAYALMQRDLTETAKVIFDIMRDMDKCARNHELDVELDAQLKRNEIAAARADGQRHALLGQQTTRALGAAPPAAAPETPSWTSEDALSKRAKVITMKAENSVDDDEIADPYVAFAALTYARTLRDTDDPRTARSQTFTDVREMLEQDGVKPKEAAGYTAQRKTIRADARKNASARSALDDIASAIRGGGA